LADGHCMSKKSTRNDGSFCYFLPQISR
jgi:hypothetical protein